MENRIDISSFKKGKEFEDYIQNIIFPKEQYDLVHRTHDYEQNSQRFVEDTNKPDFKFRCRISKQEFYIEAKYRSKYIEDKIQVMNVGQFYRFKEINSTECPVFILIGCEGQPGNPESISLFSMKEIELYLPFEFNLFKSKLRGNKIKKAPYNSEELNNHIVKIKSNSENIASKKNEHIPDLKLTVKKIINKRIPIAVLIIAVVVIASIFIPQIKTFLFPSATSNVEYKPNVTPGIKLNADPKPADKTTTIDKHEINNVSKPADVQITIDMLNNSLVGDWSGKFVDDNLLIHIDEIDLDYSIVGYDIFGENKRELKGTIRNIGDSNFEITLLEPGDVGSDGLFKIKYSERENILKGLWKSNDGKSNIEFQLIK